MKTKSKQNPSKKKGKKTTNSPRTAFVVPGTQPPVLSDETKKYLRFLIGKHGTVEDLKPPHSHSHSVSRRMAWGRYLPITNANGIGALLINPFNFVQNTDVFVDASGTNASRAAPIYYTTSNWGGSYSSAVVPGTTGVVNDYCRDNGLSTGGYENVSGPRRWIAAKITVRFLGTALQAGTELFLYHNATMQGLMYTSQLNCMTNGRDCERATLTASKSVHTFHLFPRGIAEQDFQEAKSYANVGNVNQGTGANFNNFCDPDYFGTAQLIADAAGNPSNFGDGYSPKGWNVGLVIASAAVNQPYEILIEFAYEGRFFFKYGGGSISSASVTAANDLSHPNHVTIPIPHEAALIAHSANKIATERRTQAMPPSVGLTLIKDAFHECFPAVVKAGASFATKSLIGLLE